MLDIRADGAVPPAVIARRVLKHLLRTWRIKCKGYSEDRRLFDLQEENKRLRRMVEGMAARIAGQSELLTQRAEKRA